jgi:hypothetical protein
MRYVLIFIISLYSCTSGNEVKPTKKEAAIKNEQIAVPTFKGEEISSDINIVNTTGRKVSVLYNSVEHFLKNTETAGVYFITECMGCEPIQPYQDHLLFGQQLEIFKDHVVFHKEKLPTNSSIIKRIETHGDGKAVSFSFHGGKGRINYIKQSCNDADLYKVILQYGVGELKIKNVLNASFFEYDLDRDGKLEQYILANRNCSQELAIIRVL